MADLMRAEIIYKEGGMYIDTNVELFHDVTGVVVGAEARAAAAGKAHVLLCSNEIDLWRPGEPMWNGFYAALSHNPVVGMMVDSQGLARVRMQRAAKRLANYATGPHHLGWALQRAQNDARAIREVEVVVLRTETFTPYTAWNMVDRCNTAFQFDPVLRPNRCRYRPGQVLRRGQMRLPTGKKGYDIAFPCDPTLYPTSLGFDHFDLGASWW